MAFSLPWQTDQKFSITTSFVPVMDEVGTYVIRVNVVANSQEVYYVKEEKESTYKIYVYRDQQIVTLEGEDQYRFFMDKKKRKCKYFREHPGSCAKPKTDNEKLY